MAKFLSNTLKLLFATVLGQIIGVLVFPIISRLYTPADFGIFQLFYSIVAIIAAISCLSYQPSIVLPKKDDDAAQLFLLCLVLILISSIITGLIFFLFSDYIGNVLNAPELSTYVLWLPAAIICNSVAFVLSFWLSRKNEFGTIAKGNLFSSITGKGITIGAGMVNPSPSGLIFGTITNDVTLIAVFFRRVWGDITVFKCCSFDRMKQMAIRYKKFPLYNSGSDLAAIASAQSTPFLLAFFFSTTVVGFYSMAHTIIKLPLKLIGNSIYQVFFQNASVEMQRSGTVTNIVKLVHSRLISIGMMPFLILVIIGPELFSIALGETWYIAGIYASILSPWIFVVFLSTPLMSIFNVLEKQGINLFFNILLLSSRIVVIVIGGLLGDVIFTMVIFSITGVFFWTWMNLRILQMAGIPVREAGGELIKFIALDLLVCSPLIAAKFLDMTPVILISLAALITLVYYLVLLQRDQVLREGILRFFRSYSPLRSSNEND